MPTPTKGPRVGGGPSHERLIVSNLATALFEHDHITTTAAKAKRLRPVAERLVTFAKRGDLHARRQVLSVVRDKGAVHRLFTEIAPDMENRTGGYTRITKIGNRKGDNAPMVVIELVRERLSPKQATVAEAEAATKRTASTQTDDVTLSQPTPDDDAVVTEGESVEVPGEETETDEARGDGIEVTQPTPDDDAVVTEGESVEVPGGETPKP